MSIVIDADTLGSRLRTAREAKGLSLLDAMTEVRSLLPRSMWVTDATIRRLEVGETPEAKADPVLLATLCAVYGVKVSEMSEVAALGMGRIFQQVFSKLQPFLSEEAQTALTRCYGPAPIAA